MAATTEAAGLSVNRLSGRRLIPPNALIIWVGIVLLCCHLQVKASETAVPSAPEASAAESHRDPLQTQFILGGIALSNGDYEAAIAIFRDLARKSPTPRIRLELARALFLGRHFEEARQLFKEVRAQEDIPWSVRQNIKLYLDELDVKLGFVKFGIALVSDSNPRNFTSERRILIAGQELTIVPPEDNKEVKGIRYRMETGRALSRNQRLQGYMNLSYTDYEQGQFDRAIADGRVIYDPETFPQLKARAGLEFSMVNGSKEYDYPYLSLIYLADPIDRYRLLYELKKARLDIAGAEHLDADQYIATVGFTRRLEGAALLKGNFAFETSKAKERPYSYNGGSLGLGADFALGAWGIEPFVAFSKRHYREKDPFFDRTRDDFRKRAGVVLTARDLRFGSFVPEIGMTYDKNDSSIGFFSYDKLQFFFNLRE